MSLLALMRQKGLLGSRTMSTAPNTARGEVRKRVGFAGPKSARRSIHDDRIMELLISERDAKMQKKLVKRAASMKPQNRDKLVKLVGDRVVLKKNSTSATRLWENSYEKRGRGKKNSVAILTDAGQMKFKVGQKSVLRVKSRRRKRRKKQLSADRYERGEFGQAINSGSSMHYNSKTGKAVYHTNASDLINIKTQYVTDTMRKVNPISKIKHMTTPIKKVSPWEKLRKMKDTTGIHKHLQIQQQLRDVLNQALIVEKVATPEEDHTDSPRSVLSKGTIKRIMESIPYRKSKEQAYKPRVIESETLNMLPREFRISVLKDYQAVKESTGRIVVARAWMSEAKDAKMKGATEV